MSTGIDDSALITDIQELAASFHSLKDAPGLSPWEPEALDAWAQSIGDNDISSLSAAQFVLELWGYRADYSYSCRTPCPWRCGRFNVAAAMHAWDENSPGDCKVFAAWVADPWWPNPG